MLNVQSEINRTILSNGVTIPQIILGSFQINNYKTMHNIINAAIEHRCYGFDTSPSYGTEKNLGKAIKEVCKDRGILRNDLFVSNKVDGWQMFYSAGDVEMYVDQSLKKMGLEYFDLLLIHWPFEKYLYNTWKCFERMYEKGKVRSIGICNINIRILDYLIAKINIYPHVIQNEISPLRTCEEEIKKFNEMGITVEAYSPLCRMIPSVNSSKVLQRIAINYSKSIAQIILRWHLERGIIPIFTSTKKEHLEANLDIFNFKLSDCDIEEINKLNRDYKIFPESYGCPGF